MATEADLIAEITAAKAAKRPAVLLQVIPPDRPDKTPLEVPVRLGSW